MPGLRLVHGSCLCLLLVLPWSPPLAIAQNPSQYEYAVKVLCGPPDRPALAPGTYYTAINIHNPNADSVFIRKKFALTAAQERPGLISRFSENVLLSDQALEVDCTDIFRRTRTRFAKGFAIIQSPAALDVIAVYTAVGSTDRVETMHLERVPARQAGSCPDLVVDSIARPEWDAPNNRSVIRAVIRNIGSAPAPATIARVVDPSTPGPTGAPQNAIANTPALAPGTSATVTFYLPYWVFNPDALLDVTADYKGELAECKEDNNTLRFEARG